MKKYILEIYAPGNVEESCMTFESDTAFISFNKGDLLNPRTFDNSTYEGKDIFKIINIEHMIWKNAGDIRHKLCIFTEGVEDTTETRAVS